LLTARFTLSGIFLSQVDQEHRKRICNEALQGLIALGLDDATGKAVLNAINKGLVPNVKIEF
jgi:hypothetical protein